MEVAVRSRKTLLGAALVVALSTVFLRTVRGYGTILSQNVVLGGWALIAFLTSESFADHHSFLVWAAVLVLNVFCFSEPALIILFVVRNRSRLLASGSLVAWLVFYLGALFILFPATDGP